MDKIKEEENELKCLDQRKIYTSYVLSIDKKIKTKQL